MTAVGIVCEYNPFHLGHLHQLRRIRDHFGPGTPIVCAMSGNYVQRGAPAILDKSLRAKAAVLSGADLVVELPVTASLSSAEGFAGRGVEILSRLCSTLCFGAEAPDPAWITRTAEALLSGSFPPLLCQALEQGCSFPAARQQALAAMGIDAKPLSQPNNILAVEYTKAILAQGSRMDIFPIFRPGDYHARIPDRENPSATALREKILAGGSWDPYLPPAAQGVFSGAVLHCLAQGERAILARLRTMSEEEFAALPYGSEGLWRKLMHASRRQATLEDVLTQVKSKRYTRSRLDRMVMCAFLGIRKELLEAPLCHVRVLAFDNVGRQLLREKKKEGFFLPAGAPAETWQQTLEARAEDLYGLFALGAPEAPGGEKRRRVFYLPEVPERT